MSLPPSRVCPLCASQDSFDPPTPLPEGGWQFTCRGSHGLYVFEVNEDDKVSPYPEGLASDLGLYEILTSLISADDELIEYGVVEYKFGLRHRKEYDRIVGIYGHGWFNEGRKYTASSFIAGVLGRLYSYGELGGEFGPATAYWNYNSTISYWCPAGAQPASTVTWQGFAEAHDLDPYSWPLLASSEAR